MKHMQSINKTNSLLFAKIRTLRQYLCDAQSLSAATTPLRPEVAARGHALDAFPGDHSVLVSLEVL